MIDRLARILRAILEFVTIGLVVALALVVVAAVVARYVFNSSFIWYDEVASVMLAWITFYGAALAMLRRRHLGFAGLIVSLPAPARATAFLVAEAVTLAVFVVFAYGGWLVLDILGRETLVSLDVPLRVTQSAVPVGCALVILAQLLSAPRAWRETMSGRTAEDDEIEEELARAREQGLAGDDDTVPASAPPVGADVASNGATSITTTRTPGASGRWSRRERAR